MKERKKHLKDNSFVNENGKRVVVQGNQTTINKDGKKVVYQQTFKKTFWEKLRDSIKRFFKKFKFNAK
jgi:hypothetical protein